MKWGEFVPPLWYAISVFIFVWVSVSSFVVGSTSFMSPDERANNFFAQTVAHDGALHVSEPYNSIAFDRVHPRATESHGGIISHSVFWGMSLVYGILARGVGMDVIPLLTPVLMLGLSVAVVRVARKHVSSETAWMLGALLLLIPGVLYFSFRAWHNNVAFTSLIALSLLGMLHLTTTTLTKFSCNVWLVISAGLFGLGILMRPLEFVWMVPLLVYAYVYYKEMRTTMVWFASAGLAMVVVYAVTTWFLQHPSLEVHQVSQVLHSGNKLPFNEQGSSLVVHILSYFGKLQWVHALLGLAGVLIVLYYRYYRKVTHDVITQYLRLCTVCLYVMGAQWLAYGIFMFNDTGLSAVTISNSYVRYWLLSSVLLLPLIAIALETVKDKYERFALGIFSAILVLTAYSSVATVYRGADGVNAMIDRHAQYDASAIQVLEKIPTDAVVVTRTLDKVIFPARAVMSERWDSAGVRESVTQLQKAQVRVFALYEVNDVVSAFQKNSTWQEKGSDKEIMFEQVYRDDTMILYEIFVGLTQ